MENLRHQRVYLKGHIDVPEDRLELVSKALPDHIALTLKEPGCLSFEVIPCSLIENRFLVSECFVNQAAFDAHQERTTASPWFQITEGIPRDYRITRD